MRQKLSSLGPIFAFDAPSPTGCQAFSDFVDAGADAGVLHRPQDLTITLACHDRAQNVLACLARNVGDDVGQLDIHLRERLLHVLHVPTLAPEQRCTRSPQRAQHAHLAQLDEMPR